MSRPSASKGPRADLAVPSDAFAGVVHVGAAVSKNLSDLWFLLPPEERGLLVKVCVGAIALSAALGFYETPHASLAAVQTLLKCQQIFNELTTAHGHAMQAVCQRALAGNGALGKQQPILHCLRESIVGDLEELRYSVEALVVDSSKQRGEEEADGNGEDDPDEFARLPDLVTPKHESDKTSQQPQQPQSSLAAAQQMSAPASPSNPVEAFAPADQPSTPWARHLFGRPSRLSSSLPPAAQVPRATSWATYSTTGSDSPFVRLARSSSLHSIKDLPPTASTEPLEQPKSKQPSSEEVGGDFVEVSLPLGNGSTASSPILTPADSAAEIEFIEEQPNVLLQGPDSNTGTDTRKETQDSSSLQTDPSSKDTAAIPSTLAEVHEDSPKIALTVMPETQPSLVNDKLAVPASATPRTAMPTSTNKTDGREIRPNLKIFFLQPNIQCYNSSIEFKYSLQEVPLSRERIQAKLEALPASYDVMDIILDLTVAEKNAIFEGIAPYRGKLLYALPSKSEIFKTRFGDQLSRTISFIIEAAQELEATNKFPSFGVFGVSATSKFPSFGLFGVPAKEETSSCPGTVSLPFVPTTIAIPGQGSTATEDFQTLTAFSPFHQWSLEELRYADYNRSKTGGTVQLSDLAKDPESTLPDGRVVVPESASGNTMPNSFSEILQYQSITFNPALHNWSFEELRCADYQKLKPSSIAEPSKPANQPSSPATNPPDSVSGSEASATKTSPHAHSSPSRSSSQTRQDTTERKESDQAGEKALEGSAPKAVGLRATDMSKAKTDSLHPSTGELYTKNSPFRVVAGDSAPSRASLFGQLGNNTTQPQSDASYSGIKPSIFAPAAALTNSFGGSTSEPKPAPLGFSTPASATRTGELSTGTSAITTNTSLGQNQHATSTTGRKQPLPSSLTQSNTSEVPNPFAPPPPTPNATKQTISTYGALPTTVSGQPFSVLDRLPQRVTPVFGVPSSCAVAPPYATTALTNRNALWGASTAQSSIVCTKSATGSSQRPTPSVFGISSATNTAASASGNTNPSPFSSAMPHNVPFSNFPRQRGETLPTGRSGAATHQMTTNTPTPPGNLAFPMNPGSQIPTFAASGPGWRENPTSVNWSTNPVRAPAPPSNRDPGQGLSPHPTIWDTYIKKKEESSDK